MRWLRKPPPVTYRGDQPYDQWVAQVGGARAYASEALDRPPPWWRRLLRR